MGEILLHNQRGALVVWRELLKAMVESRLDRVALVSHALAMSERMRDHLLASTQPDALIAGVDAETAYWRDVMSKWPGGGTAHL